jgi:Xaa-Pro aminopeptidase
MKERGIAAVAVGPTAYMTYLTGAKPHADERACLYVVTPQKAAFLMPALNADQIRSQLPAGAELPFHIWSDAEGPEATLAGLVSALGLAGAAHVDVDESMRADFALLFLDAVKPASRGFAGASLGALRMCKTAQEIAEIDRNAAIDDEAMRAAFACVKAGLRECDVAAEVIKVFGQHDAKPLFTIIGAGSNGAFPHHSVSERVIAQGDAIVIDIGARQGLFSSDITRMAVIGTPSAEYLEVHGTVERAVQAALKAAKPGVKARAVDEAARNVIAAAGYGEFFTHRTGHGLGLEGHEPPYLTETSETVLEEGMVFSIEPGIYLPGKFGVRLEEIVVLEKDGPRIVSKLPRDPHVVTG